MTKEEGPDIGRPSKREGYKFWMKVDEGGLLPAVSGHEADLKEYSVRPLILIQNIGID